MYIQSARCWAHARRPLFLLLQNEGLIEIYNKYLLPKGSVFTDFEANLDKYMKDPKDRALTDRDRTLLVIFYLINMLFVIDSTVYAVSICHKISHQDCHDLSSKIA